MKRPHKYGAKPTEVDGIRFASMKEAKRYQELKLLERAGEITALGLQPAYDLVAGEDRTVIGVYRADFIYFDVRRKTTVVEDVKGFRTPVYRLKKKFVEAQYGITVREV